MSQKLEDLDDFRGTVRGWLNEADIPEIPLDLNERFTVLRNWQKTLYNAQLVGIAWSRDAGGQGLTLRHQLVLSEELARAGAPQPIGLIGLDVVGPSIDQYGSREQKAELLPRLLSGQDIWCQGFSEPEAGSDLASLRTHARVDGAHFVINGHKVWTSWAHKAQWCAVLARTDPEAAKHKGISYILVDMSSPGVTSRPLVQMTGDDEFGEVYFDDVRVPVENLVGELNEGWAIAQDTLGNERGSYTLRRYVEFEGALTAALNEVVAHFTNRIEEVPDWICENLGKASIAVDSLESQARNTMDRKLAHKGPHPLDSVDKLCLTESEQILFSSIADLLGPLRNVTDSYPYGLHSERWVKDHYYSRAASIYGGTNQIQRNIVADRLLRLPRG